LATPRLSWPKSLPSGSWEHLARSGFVVMRKPPIDGAAALGRGWRRQKTAFERKRTGAGDSSRNPQRRSQRRLARLRAVYRRTRGQRPVCAKMPISRPARRWDAGLDARGHAARRIVRPNEVPSLRQSARQSDLRAADGCRENGVMTRAT